MKSAAKWICLTGFVLMTAFWIGQSVLTGEESAAVSGAAGGVLEGLFSAIFPDPTGQGRPIGEWWEGYETFVRKFLGHFCGFAAEGFFAAGSAYGWLKGRVRYGLTAGFGVGFALLTELLQSDLINEGRTLSLADVALNVAGYLAGCGVAAALIWLWHRRTRGEKKEV